jgi:hypothetical protein
LIGSAVGFATLGGDIGVSHSWQAGLSYLNADVENRAGGIHPNEELNEVEGSFTGDDDVAAIDVVYKWAPQGNPTERNFKFQAEYFTRDEEGVATLDEVTPSTSTLDARQSGWYAQGIYQFVPKWRVGLRYDQLDAENDGSNPAVLTQVGLDGEGHTPRRSSVMLDYSYSEFSRFRLQYNRDESYPNTDNQVFAQYLMSLGAHGAHAF